MRGDMPDGSFSEAELERLQAEGVIEIHQPGTPEYEVAVRAMAEQSAAHDAELLERDGPDALTGERLMRQAAIGAEQNPEFVGYALAEWCREHGWERSDLADYLGVTVNQLAAMALVPVCQGHLAERYGADPERFVEVLG